MSLLNPRPLCGAEALYDAMANRVAGASKVCVWLSIEGLSTIHNESVLVLAGAALAGLQSAAVEHPMLRAELRTGSQRLNLGAVGPDSVQLQRIGSDADTATAATTLAQWLCNKNFNTSDDGIVRTATLHVLTLARGDALSPVALLLELHHMICDGVSAAALLVRIAARFASALAGDGANADLNTAVGQLPPIAISSWPPTIADAMRAAVPWTLQRLWLAGRALAMELTLPPHALLFPTPSSRNAVRTTLISDSLSVSATVALRDASRARGVTVNAALNAAVALTTLDILCENKTEPTQGPRNVLIRSAVSLRPMLAPHGVPPLSLGYFVGSASSWTARQTQASSPDGGRALFWTAAEANHRDVTAARADPAACFGVPLLKEYLTSVFVKRMAGDGAPSPPATVTTSNVGVVSTDGVLLPPGVSLAALQFASSVNAWCTPEVTAATLCGRLSLTFAFPTPLMDDALCSSMVKGVMAWLQRASDER